jgi:hypothetical protein
MVPLKQKVSVFFTYAHHDKKTVFKLYQRMVKDEINVWLDSERLEPGQNWQHEIRRAILKSDVVLVCLSQKFNEQQGYRHEELKLALEKAKLLDDRIFIIPVRLEKCDLPECLRHLHRVDLFEEGGYQKLLYALQKIEKSCL